MSLRKHNASTMLPSASAVEALATIERAQAANHAWMSANTPQSIDGKSSWGETYYEAKDPWTLVFEQKVDTAGPYNTDSVVVTHTIMLNDGAYSRLRGMVTALTDALQPVYEGAGWTVASPGDVYKVCKYPDASFGSWTFTKLVPAPIAGWVIPGGAANPERALRSIFGVSYAVAQIAVDINDVSYVITESEAEQPGAKATFQIARASWLRDKVAN